MKARRDRNPGAHDARAAGVFPGRCLHTRERSFCRDRCRRLPAVSPRRGHIFRTTSPSNSHRLKVRPERRRLASRRRRGTGPRRVQSRVSGAPALAIAFFVSVARREASSTNPPSRRPATDPRPPLRLHRTLRRWLPRTVPLSSSPPSLSTRVTPTSSPTRCVIARLSIRALSFNADRRFFARRDRENEPRRRRSVASTAIIATCFGRSADETSSPHHPTDLRRCPRCLPRPGSRLQGASPAA